MLVSHAIFNDIKTLPLLLYNFKAKVTMEEGFKNIINNTNATFFILSLKTVVLDQTNEFSILNHFFNYYQSGFRYTKFTGICSFDNGWSTVMILTDVQKAFGTINHGKQWFHLSPSNSKLSINLDNSFLYWKLSVNF